MTHPSNENIRRVLAISREMIALADEGDRDRNDESCAVLFGILRDMAYRLRKLADEECEKHKTLDKWD